jgi:hypothetical protein
MDYRLLHRASGVVEGFRLIAAMRLAPWPASETLNNTGRRGA